MLAERGNQARVAQGFTEGGKTADPPQRAERLVAQDIQGAVAVRAVEYGEGNHADCRETGADYQGIGQHHGQGFAQGGRQGVAQVNRDHQGDQPGAQLAQGKAQHVPGARVLRQLFGQAEALAHSVAEPDQRSGQQAPYGQDHGKTEDDRQPFAGRQHQGGQFILGQVDFIGPAPQRAVGAGKLLLKARQRTADQPEYPEFGGGLGLLRGGAQLLQVAEQLGALLVVFEGLDHFVQRLPQGHFGLGLGLAGTAQHPRQAYGLGGR